MKNKSYNPFTNAKRIIKKGGEVATEAVEASRTITTKPVKPKENIKSHEAGLKKLEEEARQNQLRRRKMTRG